MPSKIDNICTLVDKHNLTSSEFWKLFKKSKKKDTSVTIKNIAPQKGIEGAHAVFIMSFNDIKNTTVNRTVAFTHRNNIIHIIPCKTEEGIITYAHKYLPIKAYLKKFKIKLDWYKFKNFYKKLQNVEYRELLTASQIPKKPHMYLFQIQQKATEKLILLVLAMDADGNYVLQGLTGSMFNAIQFYEKHPDIEPFYYQF